MSRIWVRQMFDTIADIGRQYLLPSSGGASAAAAAELCRDLLSHKGEASGTALARQVIDIYAAMEADEQVAFLKLLARDFGPDSQSITTAARTYVSQPNDQNYARLSEAVESPRQELIRRLNMPRGGTAAIIDMRARLISVLREHPELAPVDQDLKHLLGSWFNRGFLQFERIDWRTPAVVLEKLIAYEAVHAIQGWDDLRRRLADDRRCFAFFHPALPDEPLIFVEVALVAGMAGEIAPLLEIQAGENEEGPPDTAVFYSISNCQSGLAGISFGNFLIKQVADTLSTELPQIKTFATLSPIPGFLRWLTRTDPKNLPVDLDEEERAVVTEPLWWENEPARQHLKDKLVRLCAHYLLTAKSGEAPADPVARFHLGNGASVDRLNWAADQSQKGLCQSAGMMVNYLYERDDIIANHEAFTREGRITASSAVRRLAG